MLEDHFEDVQPLPTLGLPKWVGAGFSTDTRIQFPSAIDVTKAEAASFSQLPDM